MQAAAILLAASGIFLFKTQKSGNNTPALTYTTVSAPNGVKKQWMLPDGTEVFINSGSSIRIASNFGVKNREVDLTGEAYFQVKHNALKPFSIRTNKLIIADIGTSFNVKAYPADEQIKVAVESGIVSVSKSNANLKVESYAKSITKNQQFTYNKQSQRHALNTIRASDAIAWKQNQLRFDDASFEEIAGQLERWYNVSVKLNHNTGHYRRYTLSFNNEPVGNVLKVLSSLSGINYQISNNSISINLKNCKKA
nr:FecR family protein [Mucilaginibacter sp. FT3.2]